METTRNELNRNLAQMLKGGVIMHALPKMPARAPSWRWSAFRLTSAPPVA